MHNVLIIEDLSEVQEFFKQELKDFCQSIHALSVEEAERLFDQSKESLSAIAVDACVPGTTPTTIPLVTKIRQNFSGPIIAISNSDIYRQELRRAGCDYDCEKESLPSLLRKILPSAT